MREEEGEGGMFVDGRCTDMSVRRTGLVVIAAAVGGLVDDVAVAKLVAESSPLGEEVMYPRSLPSAY